MSGDKSLSSPSSTSRKTFSFQSVARAVLPTWISDFVTPPVQRESVQSTLLPTSMYYRPRTVDMVEIIRNRSQRRATAEPFFKFEEKPKELRADRRLNLTSSLLPSAAGPAILDVRKRSASTFPALPSQTPPLPVHQYKRARFEEARKFLRNSERSPPHCPPVRRRRRRFSFCQPSCLFELEESETPIKPMGFSARNIELLKYMARRDVEQCRQHPCPQPTKIHLIDPPKDEIEAAIESSQRESRFIEKIGDIVKKTINEEQKGWWTCRNCHCFVSNSPNCEKCGISKYESNAIPFSFETKKDGDDVVDVVIGTKLARSPEILIGEQETAKHETPSVPITPSTFRFGESIVANADQQQQHQPSKSVSFNFGHKDSLAGFFTSTPLISKMSEPLAPAAPLASNDDTLKGGEMETELNPEKGSMLFGTFNFGHSVTAPSTTAAATTPAPPPTTTVGSSLLLFGSSTTFGGNGLTKTDSTSAAAAACSGETTTAKLNFNFGAASSTGFGSLKSSEVSNIAQPVFPETSAKTQTSFMGGFGGSNPVESTNVSGLAEGALGQKSLFPPRLDSSAATLFGGPSTTESDVSTRTSSLFGGFGSGAKVGTTESGTLFSSSSATTSTSNIFGGGTSASSTTAQPFGLFGVGTVVTTSAQHPPVEPTSSTAGSSLFGTSLSFGTGFPQQTPKTAAETPFGAAGPTSNAAGSETTTTNPFGAATTKTSSATTFPGSTLFGGGSGFGKATDSGSLFGNASSTPFAGLGKTTIEATAVPSTAAASPFGMFGTVTPVAAAQQQKSTLFGGGTAAAAATTAPSEPGGLSQAPPAIHSLFSSFGATPTTTTAGMTTTNTTLFFSSSDQQPKPSSTMAAATQQGSTNLFGEQTTKQAPSGPSNTLLATGSTLFGQPSTTTTNQSAANPLPSLFGGTAEQQPKTFAFGSAPSNPPVQQSPFGHLFQDSQSTQLKPDFATIMATTNTNPLIQNIQTNAAEHRAPSETGSAEASTHSTNPFMFQADDAETISQRKIRHGKRQKK